MNPKRIIVHHSATKDSQSLSWDDIERAHIKRGFVDIGYHYGVEQVEDSYQSLIGRPVVHQGAHCKGHNEDSIGICVIGNFNFGRKSMLQIDKTAELLATLCVVHHIPVQYIYKHRDFTATDCPGKNFPWAYLIQSVIEWIRTSEE